MSAAPNLQSFPPAGAPIGETIDNLHSQLSAFEANLDTFDELLEEDFGSTSELDS